MNQISELQEQFEEQQVAHEGAIEALQQENADLQKQIESLEKQLKSNRHFLEVGICFVLAVYLGVCLDVCLGYV